VNPIAVAALTSSLHHC